MFFKFTQFSFRGAMYNENSTDEEMVGYDAKKQQLNNLEYALAGAFAGAATRCLGQPFDVLKIRFQLQVEPISKHSQSSKYRALLQATKLIVEEEGLFGLWKGHLSGQFLSITYGIFQFQSFEILTKASQKYLRTSERSPYVHAVCGGMAGSIATVASFPFDVMRTRFIAQGNTKMYTSLPNAVELMLKNEGPIAFFKGLMPAVILVAPQAGAIFTFHNLLTSLVSKTRLSTETELKFVGNLVVGSLAGLLGKTVVYPLDLARKRLQLQGFEEGRKGFGENFTCRGLLNCLMLTLKNEGISGLYKGLSPSIVKAAVTTGLHFTFYDEACKLLAAAKK